MSHGAAPPLLNARAMQTDLAAPSALALDAALARPRAASAEGEPCLHCGTPIAGDAGPYCCTGCEAVHGLLRAQGLTRYYDLRGESGTPVAAPPSSGHDLKWLEAIEARVAAAEGACRVELDVQGLHCAACVWLLGELFRRHPGALRDLVNPGVGRVELTVTRAFPLRAYVRDVESFGYAFGPPLKSEAPASRALVTRLGVCAALTVNAMIFSLPLYLGLRAGPIHSLFAWLSFLLALASVAAGGSVFLRSAWQSVRRRVVHLDLPIALGIVLTFAGSTWAFAVGRDGRGAYFDTLSTFITLMLAGRWLQERVLERNRRYLLASDGVEGMLTRRVRDGDVALVRCSDLSAGDVLLIAPGDVVPVDGDLLDDEASCSLDWISGESVPRAFARGETVPAGSFNVGQRAVRVRSSTDFAASPLVGLLRSPAPRADAARATPWWRRLAAAWVAGVLSLAALGFVGWTVVTGDPRRAMEVATAVLIVTCPCAFGIATPMAYELVQAGLRRAGLFVRSPSFLDRATAVRRVVFDKTGTLTTGALRLANPGALGALAPENRAALYNLAVRSTHPKSLAVRAALSDAGLRFDEALDVREQPGRGVEAVVNGRLYRLGEPAWALGGLPGADCDVALSVEGSALALLRTAEVLRPDARAEVAQLVAEGREVWILSGDAPERVAAMAQVLGVPAERAVGGLTPEAKALWLEAHDLRDTLMVGDGINDALAVERAFCSGTPAIDRPFMPARTDFYVVSAGLRPVGLALRAAHALAEVHRRNLGIALAYNAVTVGLALAGRMSPLLCAVVMPASSLSILLATVASLSPRSPLWKSSSSRSS